MNIFFIYFFSLFFFFDFSFLPSELEDLEYCEGKKEVYGGAVEVKVVRMLKGTEPLVGCYEGGC